jgi:hypothetical protein
MENNVNTNTVNNSNNSNNETTAQAPRQREHGNFRGQRVMRDLSELDPKQFPAQKPREERIPVWAQQLQKSIDLLSQEQQKMVNQMDALLLIHQKPADEDTLKPLIEAGFAKVRENQKHSYEELFKKIDFATEETVRSNQAIYNLHSNVKGSVMDICGMLQKIHEELQPRAKRTLVWKVFHPITALKEWWSANAEERRQKKAEKLKAQLEALQAQK